MDKRMGICLDIGHTKRINRDPVQDLKDYFDRYLTMKLGNFRISDDEITEDGRGSITVHPLKGDVA